MDPVMRIILTVVGALAGAILGSDRSRFFDELIGAVTGFAIADLAYIRARVRTLETGFDRLKGTHVSPAPPVSRWEPPSAVEPPAAAAQVLAVASPNTIAQDIRRFFGGGNLLVRSGVIVLFFGIAFLLRCAR
jgi:hypothetical protein